MEDAPTLQSLRAEIDQINYGLLELLSKRGQLARQVAALKQRDGLPSYDAAREASMLAALCERNRGPFSDQAVSALFGSIFAASRELGAW